MGRCATTLFVVLLLAGGAVDPDSATAAPSVFTPSWLSGTLKWKEKGAGSGVYPTVVKLTAAMYEPGTFTLDTASDNVGITFGEALYSIGAGFSPGNEDMKCRNGKCAFKRSFMKVKGDAATGVFVAKVKYWKEGTPPTNPFRIQIMINGSSAQAQGAWTADMRKPGRFTYP